ncbi:MAG: hypothetical protein V4474_01885 [Patescibacteria group bacterium]
MPMIPALINPHTHLREQFEEGDVVDPLIQYAIEGGARLLGPMPNTRKGLMNAGDVKSYLAHARACVQATDTMVFVGIVQITETTTKADIDACVNAGILDAKVYPKGRTTKSHNGVQHYARILDVVRHCGEVGMRVHFHPEHPSEHFDNRDAEFAFLPIMDIFFNETKTTLVWEHGTDARCIPFWEEWAKSGRFFLTITAHHLLINETTSYGDVGAISKPPAKKEIDRRGLIALIAKDYPWVMAGGDDAAHPVHDKHRVGNCACGAYTAPFLLALYAHALLSHMRLDVFAKFISGNAQALYKTDVKEFLRLTKKPFQIPLSYEIGPWKVEPFWAGKTIDYTLEKNFSA